ncbi:hypothetical protein EB093_04185 [bacterium]|nr:hypothetical protein [bacterium]
MNGTIRGAFGDPVNWIKNDVRKSFFRFKGLKSIACHWVWGGQHWLKVTNIHPPIERDGMVLK